MLYRPHLKQLLESQKGRSSRPCGANGVSEDALTQPVTDFARRHSRSQNPRNLGHGVYPFPQRNKVAAPLHYCLPTIVATTSYLNHWQNTLANPYHPRVVSITSRAFCLHSTTPRGREA